MSVIATGNTPPTFGLPQIPFARPMIGEMEKQAVLDVLDGPVLVHGPQVLGFEAAFAAWVGAPRAVAVASCTAGMHLLWFALGLGAGDEVIVPAMTHVATAHAVELTGARAVFVDAEPASGNIDPARIAEKITSRTKGIAVVHFLGEPVSMEPVVALARRHGLFVLEDCALAMGTRSRGVHAGLLGDAGAFSFYPVKHMTTAEGGMVICRDPDLAARVAHLRAFGVDRSHGERAVPGSYDVTDIGFNYRLNELAAALGLVQLKRLDGFLAQRRANFDRLAAGLVNLDRMTILPASRDEMTGSCYCLQIVLPADRTDCRASLVDFLRARGIGTSVYYPRPVPLMTYYRNRYQGSPRDWPVASWLADGSVSLPVGPHLDEAAMDRIAGAVASGWKEIVA